LPWEGNFLLNPEAEPDKRIGGKKKAKAVGKQILANQERRAWRVQSLRPNGAS